MKTSVFLSLESGGGAGSDGMGIWQTADVEVR